jgi:hypothetical protein
MGLRGCGVDGLCVTDDSAAGGWTLQPPHQAMVQPPSTCARGIYRASVVLRAQARPGLSLSHGHATSKMRAALTTALHQQCEPPIGRHLHGMQCHRQCSRSIVSGEGMMERTGEKRLAQASGERNGSNLTAVGQGQGVRGWNETGCM